MDLGFFQRRLSPTFSRTFIFKGWTSFLREKENQTKSKCGFYLINFEGWGWGSTEFWLEEGMLNTDSNVNQFQQIPEATLEPKQLGRKL